MSHWGRSGTLLGTQDTLMSRSGRKYISCPCLGSSLGHVFLASAMISTSHASAAGAAHPRTMVKYIHTSTTSRDHQQSDWKIYRASDDFWRLTETVAFIWTSSKTKQSLLATAFRVKYWNEKGTRSCHEPMLACMGMPKAILYYTCIIAPRAPA